MMTAKKNVACESLVDFHTHILPNMDDGSASLEMSTQMIQKLAESGTGYIVLTPHFYPSRDYPDHFLSKRAKRLSALSEHLQSQEPILVPGAEIQYFDGITVMRELPELRLGNSPGLLIEMPFCEWTNRMVEDVLDLNRRKDIRVVLAHIERYISMQEESVIRRLVDNGVLIQANASFFTGFFSSRKAIAMLDDGMIHLLGTDCHNMTSRPPNLAAACACIRRRRGEEAVTKIMKCGMELLQIRVEGVEENRGATSTCAQA